MFLKFFFTFLCRFLNFTAVFFYNKSWFYFELNSGAINQLHCLITFIYCYNNDAIVQAGFHLIYLLFLTFIHCGKNFVKCTEGNNNVYNFYFYFFLFFNVFKSLFI